MADDPPRELAFGHRIAIQHAGETVVITSRDGDAMLTVELTERGPVLRLSGASLAIEATDELSLRCDTLAVEARQARFDIGERLHAEIGTDATLCAGGTMSLEGRCVSLAADPGGMWLRANDDVDIQGERVRLNCDDPPMPLEWDRVAALARARDDGEDA